MVVLPWTCKLLKRQEEDEEEDEEEEEEEVPFEGPCLFAVRLNISVIIISNHRTAR